MRMFLKSVLSCWSALLLLAGCSGPAPTTVVHTTSSMTATRPPTATYTITPSPSPTPTSTATPTPDATATRSAQATATTSAILDIIGPDLERAEVSPEEGRLAWFQTEPFTLTLDSFRENQMFPIANRMVFSDFVLQSDITWRSRVGLAGCGFSFRSGPSLTEDLHYEFIMLRLEGLPAWDVAAWQGTQPLGSLTDEVMRSRAIDQAQGATNRVTLVVRENQITFYANEQREQTLVDNQIASGVLAFLAGQNSGLTTCRFENTWVWDLSGAATGN